MFELYEKVRIKKNGIIGTIIDKTTIGGEVKYIVESNKKGKIEGAYGGDWPEYDCTDKDLERVTGNRTDRIMYTNIPMEEKMTIQ